MNIYEMLEAVHGLPEGEYAECGVYKGEMAQKIAYRMNTKAELFLFDSFEGHGEPHPEFDDAFHHPKGRYSDTSMKEVLDIMPLGMIICPVKGYIPETFPQIGERKFRFVHIDVDHYLPTKAACEFFKPRMVPGGIIRFDDYRHNECPGATKAVDEVFGRENILDGDYRWIAS